MLNTCSTPFFPMAETGVSWSLFDDLVVIVVCVVYIAVIVVMGRELWRELTSGHDNDL